MKFYLADFEGVGGCSSIQISDGKLVRLPPQPCKFVKIFNWNVQDDGTAFALKPGVDMVEDNLNEVYYGFNGVICGQLFVSRETDFLPVNNCDQICLRTRPGTSTTVWFAWFS